MRRFVNNDEFITKRTSFPRTIYSPASIHPRRESSTAVSRFENFKSVFFFVAIREWWWIHVRWTLSVAHRIHAIVEIVQWRLLESQFYSLDLFFESTRLINVETNDRIHSRESLICRQRKLLEQRRTMLRNYGYCIQDDANSSRENSFSK